MSMHDFDDNVIHLASAKDKHLAPEALFISALIDSGHYTPDTYGVREDQIWTNKQVHQFCVKHQAEAKRAPDIGLVRRKYPSFAYMPNQDPYWAASNLKEAWQGRMLRKGMNEAAQALNGDDADPKEAYGILRTTLDAAAITSSRLGTVTDDLFTEEADSVRVPVDLGEDGRLTRLTGGIAPGNLWYISARLGIGKSWRLLQIAVAAAEAGWNVKFYSLEMSVREVVDRIHMIALRDTYTDVWPPDRRTRAELIEEWASRSGRIDIADPTGGPIDASVIAANHEDNTIALVDYIGLMRSAAGSRAIEDWRHAATISNELKEIALAHRIPIVSAAQVNRAGEGAKEVGPEHMAQTDALGQDADLLITIRRAGDTAEERKKVRRVHEYTLVKNRHGEHGARWYTRFEPALRRFEDISTSTAHSLIDEDIANYDEI